MENRTLSKIHLLYVDDEPHNLNAFHAYFRVKPEYKIFVCRSGIEGLKILNQEIIHIVISDQKMPFMTGVEFLEEATMRNFDPVKIVVTAHRDISSIDKAFREGKIFCYHEKPWDFDMIEQSIMEAIKTIEKRADMQPGTGS